VTQVLFVTWTGRIGPHGDTKLDGLPIARVLAALFQDIVSPSIIPSSRMPSRNAFD
jgi:hypothetical protein